MKVYILASENYEGMEITSVHSTMEKALEAQSYQDYPEDIYDYDLDPPNPIDKYEDYIEYYICDDGNCPNYKCRIRPSEFVSSKYHNTYSKFIRGYGKTLEEAKLNAETHLANMNPKWP